MPVERVEHGQDRRGDGRGVRLDGGAREGARVAVDPRHEEGRVGRGARHNHVVATGEQLRVRALSSTDLPLHVIY